MLLMHILGIGEHIHFHDRMNKFFLQSVERPFLEDIASVVYENMVSYEHELFLSTKPYLRIGLLTAGMLTTYCTVVPHRSLDLYRNWRT